ncbi:MAG: NAD-dependent epimerase/dehydratase family protein [Burkholderiaceae bacterium]|nr:NAD-dependent epimerase/dehydratase family protein [Roseateles sp.]MBV8471058.1 NAD-dependent epimerase/dehydratase family protein [Burkholderiaceae bacterium]
MARGTAFVLGAAGSFGAATAQALIERGWRVRTLRRASGQSTGQPVHPSVEVHVGDAMQRSQVVEAARGCDVVVHGVNPPRYQGWRELALPMLGNAIAAAQAADARLVFPANVYVYGRDGGDRVAEDTAKRPDTVKGWIRLEMEEMIEQASSRGMRSLMVRAGDFFGSHASVNSWFSAAMVRPGRRAHAITYPGDLALGHAWAYLPDLGGTVAALLEREPDLGVAAHFNFGGHWLASGDLMIDAMRRAIGRAVAVRRLPWWLLRLASPVHPLSRELLEMRYLWQRPLRLDNRKLQAFLGSEPHTPLDAAVEQTLRGLGCLA